MRKRNRLKRSRELTVSSGWVAHPSEPEGHRAPMLSWEGSSVDTRRPDTHTQGTGAKRRYSWPGIARASWKVEMRAEPPHESASQLGYQKGRAVHREESEGDGTPLSVKEALCFIFIFLKGNVLLENYGCFWTSFSDFSLDSLAYK